MIRRPARVGVFYACLFLFLLSALYAVPRGETVLVITDPRLPESESMRVIGAADGAFVARGRYGWMSVATSPDPDFISRLRAAGALLVLSHDLAAGCTQRNDA